MPRRSQSASQINKILYNYPKVNLNKLFKPQQLYTTSSFNANSLNLEKTRHRSRIAMELPVLERKPTFPVLYEVTVRTGTHKFAGTNANVYVQLVGKYRSTPKQRLQGKGFPAGSVRIFKVHGPEIGDLQSILIETDAFDDTDCWYLQDIHVLNCNTLQQWTIPCDNWLSLWRGDGRLTKFLPAKSFNQPEFKALANTDYEVTTFTGTLRMSGTSANVYVTLFGNQLVTPKVHLVCNDGDCFRRGKKDSFRVRAPFVGPLTKIRIEHDNSGNSPGWFLEKVIISDLKNLDQPVYFFPCHVWLARDEGDGSISRDLSRSTDPNTDRIVSRYKVEVHTGSQRGAATDASVYISLFGELGTSGEHLLNNKVNNFDQGSIDEFYLTCVDVGRLRRIRIRHDNLGSSPSWFLEKVIVENLTVGGTRNQFDCHRWLADNKEDGKIERDLIENTDGIIDNKYAGVLYTLKVFTGNLPNSGTTASVYVELHGGINGRESSGKIWLKGGQFLRGRNDLFDVEIAALFSPIASLTIGHDNTGVAPAWYLNKVIVACLESGLEQTFLCDHWLSRSEGDGLICRTLHEDLKLRKSRKKSIVIPWVVSIYTGDKFGGGTDADVNMVIYGEKGLSDTVHLTNRSNNYFERGQVDKFKTSTIDVGTPTKIRVWHNAPAHFSGWFLEKIELCNNVTMDTYTFSCHRWLSKTEDDGRLIREIPAIGPGIFNPLPIVQYSVTMFIGERSATWIDSNVAICIFGHMGDSGDRVIQPSGREIEEFILEAVSLGNLEKIRVKHEGNAEWFLEKIIVKPMDDQIENELTFWCNRWISQGNGINECILYPSTNPKLPMINYNISLTLSQAHFSLAVVFLVIYGDRSETEVFRLQLADKGTDEFERSNVDLFTVHGVDVGKVDRIKVWWNSSESFPNWFISQIEVSVPLRCRGYIFDCQRWLSSGKNDGRLKLELYPISQRRIAKLKTYELTIQTGAVHDAGTDSNVFIQLFGLAGKTEVFHLINQSTEQPFQRGNLDYFKIEAANIGKIIKIKIGHNASGVNPRWFLDHVKIECQQEDLLNKTDSYWFVCQRWLSMNQDDGHVVKELWPTTDQGKILVGNYKKKDYTVKVFTGNQLNSDTDANVYVNIVGIFGDTGDVHLQRSQHFSKFGRGQIDSFRLETIDLGDILQLRVWIDDLGHLASWFLEKIEIDDPATRETFIFPCHKWLSSNDVICRQLTPQHATGRETISEIIPYQVKFITRETPEATIDVNVHVTIFGNLGNSGRHQLTSIHSRRFFQENCAVFTIEAIDLGKINKVRVESENAGFGPSWHLERVEVTNTLTATCTYFVCNVWFDNRDEKPTCHEFYSRN